MCFQTACLLFFPQLFKIEAQSEEKQFRSHVSLSSCQKPPEAKIIFHKSERAFHLNGSADPPKDPFSGHDICFRFGSFFLILFSDPDFFWLFGICRFAAFFPSRTAFAILSAVMTDDHVVLAVLVFALPIHGKCFPHRTHVSVRFSVIFHVFRSSDLVLKLFCFLYVVVLRFNEADLSVLF